MKKIKKHVLIILMLLVLFANLSLSYCESNREEDVYRVNRLHNQFSIEMLYDNLENTHTNEELDQITVSLLRKELFSKSTVNSQLEIKSLPVPTIGQFESSWCNDPMYNSNGTSSTTIGYSGCNITAHAAVASFMNSLRNYTPSDVNNKLIEVLGQSVEYIYNNTTLNNFLALQYSSNDFIANNNGISYSTLFFQALEKIRLNRPVIIGYRYGTNFERSHFIVIDGFEYDSSITPDKLNFLYSTNKDLDYLTENLNNLSSSLGQIRIMDPRDQGSKKWVNSTYFSDKKITRIIMYKYK